MVIRFPAKKNAGSPKAPRNFPPRKYGILHPGRVDLGFPSNSHRVCADERKDGRTDGCTDVRTDGHVTITSQPKFLGLIGYQISLAMELRWRALPAGSATRIAPIVHSSSGQKTFTHLPVQDEYFFILDKWISQSTHPTEEVEFVTHTINSCFLLSFEFPKHLLTSLTDLVSHKFPFLFAHKL